MNKTLIWYAYTMTSYDLISDTFSAEYTCLFCPSFLSLALCPVRSFQSDSGAGRQKDAFSMQNQPAQWLMDTFIVYLQWYAPLRP